MSCHADLSHITHYTGVRYTILHLISCFSHLATNYVDVSVGARSLSANITELHSVCIMSSVCKQSHFHLCFFFICLFMDIDSQNTGAFPLMLTSAKF